MKSRNPHTHAEWQEAADSSEFLLSLDSCRQYGLIETDIRIDTDRCRALLARAKERGIVPRAFPELVQEFLVLDHRP